MVPLKLEMDDENELNFEFVLLPVLGLKFEASS